MWAARQDGCSADDFRGYMGRIESAAPCWLGETPLSSQRKYLLKQTASTAFAKICRFSCRVTGYTCAPGALHILQKMRMSPGCQSVFAE
ncbi:hypothetical protein DIE02_26275 [Burkholderia sp. Bp8991]|nr:hypothetical protein DIE02_26275 [Burkholderia sp. Bp8991]